ncbi:MAG: hypothetical protein Q4A47_04965 [Erysipelotrichaceae bacterium]|nr:hypothetical protein [Erysipelotrichaceae bacterium]
MENEKNNLEINSSNVTNVSAFKSIEEKKEIEVNDYQNFANGFPEWSLEPPQMVVRKK